MDIERVEEQVLTDSVAEAVTELRSRRNFLIMQIGALDAVADESWFDAKVAVDKDLSALERSVR